MKTLFLIRMLTIFICLVAFFDLSTAAPVPQAALAAAQVAVLAKPERRPPIPTSASARLRPCKACIIAAAGMPQGCESGGALPLTKTAASQTTNTVTVTGASGSTQHSVHTEILVQTGSGLNT